jgi:hypothetical protein
VLSYTHSATAGSTVVAVASVPGRAPTCTGTLRYGTVAVRSTARVRGNRVSLRWRTVASTPTSEAALTIACAGSASATVHLKINGTPVAAAATVAKFGFTASSDLGMIDYGAVLINPSSTQDALNVQMTATFSVGGQVVTTDAFTLPDVPAGATFYYGGFVPFDAGSPAPTKMQLTPLVGGHQAAARLPAAPVTNLQVMPDDFLGTQIDGQIADPYSRTLSTATAITYVLFNKAGKVLSGGVTFPSAALPPSNELTFQDYDETVTTSSVASISASVSPDFG